MPPQPEPAVKTALRLIDSIATGALSTLARADGAPFVSLVLVGLPLYTFLKARRERLGLAVEPADQVDEPATPVIDLAGSR